MGGAPFWMLAVYALFSTAIDHSLYWLKKHRFASSILGGIGGAFCYKVGVWMGAAEFLMEGWGSLLVIGAVWAAFSPLVYLYSCWLDRFSPSY